MPRGPAPGWKAPAPHTVEAQPYIAAAQKIGFETELHWNGLASRERAAECKRGLFNAARLAGVSVSTETETESGGTFRIKFKIHDKKVARAYIVQKHGSDRSRWPYNARARG